MDRPRALQSRHRALCGILSFLLFLSSLLPLPAASARGQSTLPFAPGGTGTAAPARAVSPWFPGTHAATDDQPRTAQDEVDHPRRAMAERAFHRLKEALSPDYPMVRDSTLHFVDLPIANAWVNQNAEIYVATGLLDLLETEDQIAGVLAHEFAHVTQQHVPKQIRRHLQWFLLVLALSFVGDRSDFDRDQRRKLGVLYPVVLYAYSREAELEADEVAFQHIARTDYDPSGLLEALEKLVAQSARLPVDELWTTHPLPEVRLGALRRQLDPRMGIPLRKPLQNPNLPRVHYEDPVDAALNVIQATWTDPDRLAVRVGSSENLPPALQPEASPGVYPRSWPADFPVRVLGVDVERENRSLLTHVVEGRLQLESPLGVLRSPTFRVSVQPAAEGWRAARVEILSPASDGTRSWDSGEAVPAAVARLVETLGRRITAGEEPVDGDPSGGSPYHPLPDMAAASRKLRAAGFSLRMLPPGIRPLDAEVFHQFAPPLEVGDGGSNTDRFTYWDVLLAWNLQGPEGEILTAEQRLWLAVQVEVHGARLVQVFDAPLELETVS